MYYISDDATNPNYGKDIRLYKLQNWFKKMLDTLTKERLQLEKNIERRFLFANGSNTLFLFIRDIVAYTTLITMVATGTIDLVMFVFLTGIVTGFSKWLNEFIESSNNIRKVNIPVNEFRNCIEMETSDDIDEGLDASLIEGQITIEFKNVTFTYAQAKEPTLKNLSFKMEKGEKVALVGNNGAGKTTIVKLLCGLYTPDSGEILINDINICRGHYHKHNKDDGKTYINHYISI